MSDQKTRAKPAAVDISSFLLREKTAKFYRPLKIFRYSVLKYELISDFKITEVYIMTVFQILFMIGQEKIFRS